MCPIRVGDGRHNSFWHDVWMGDSLFAVIFHMIFALDVYRHATVREQMDIGWMLRLSGKFLEVVLSKLSGIISFH